MEEEHAKYSPSQLPRIIRCPGSVHASQHYEDESSSFAEEGTMLHEVMEKCLLIGDWIVPDVLIQEKNLTPEHVEACDDCLEFVFSILAANTDKPQMHIESQVSLSYLANRFKCDGLHDVYGTADLILEFPDLIYVIDWKFGMGIEVFPDSEQLSAYALGALYGMNTDNIRIIVAQPRLYSGEKFKSRDTTRQELEEWCEKRLVPPLSICEDHDAPLNPSEKGCRWCKAKSQCSARYTNALKTAKSVFEVHAKGCNMVSIENLAKLVGDARMLKKYIGDIETFLVNTLKKGTEVPGYKLVAGRSNRVWATINEAGMPNKMLEHIENLGLDMVDVSTMKIMGPAAVEKVLKKNLGVPAAKDEDFLALIDKPEGKPTMVPESDRRKALKFADASEVFKDFT